MKKRTKKTLATVTACAMLGAVAVGGTLAYLTDNETATNTITVGDVKADLIEPEWPGNDDDDVKLVVPTEVITKDPQIANTGKSEAIVFMSVEVPYKAVTTIGIDGTGLDNNAKEVVYFKLAKDEQTTLATNFNDAAGKLAATDPEVEGNWLKLSETKGATTVKYVFAYNQKLAAGKKTEPLFETIQLVNAVDEDDFSVDGEDIVLTAYAIQSDNVLSTEDGDLTVDMTDTDALKALYNILVNQETAKDGGTLSLNEADTNNDLKLDGSANN